MRPELSILICHMPERAKLLSRLLDAIHKQADALGYDNGREYEVLTNRRTEFNVGQKRNQLMAESKGRFITFIDDDDMILKGYIEGILEAIKSDPQADHVGISGIITTNGHNQRQWHISSRFGSWYEQEGVYYRTPNHISPVLREIAVSAGFPETSYGEDYQYSMDILPHLKKEVIVKGNIYHYDFKSK